MKLAFWTKCLLSLFLLFGDVIASTAIEKSHGSQIPQNRVRRKKSASEISRARLQRRGRQAVNALPDRSYDFGFKTPEYQRRENADALGRVRGLYSFIDDVGEKHLVRYAASADTGFEVLNSVPDASKYVQYSAPLYKTSPKARGRIAYERGPGRQYKFISAGPDQRRSESTGPDGVTRGAFSYLDDKGVQRSIQYIAGANIGYRIIQDTTGPGTHLLPRPSVVEFGILYPRQPPGGNGPDTNSGIPTDDGGDRRGTSGIGGPSDGLAPHDGTNSIDTDGSFGDDFDDGNRKDGSDSFDSDFPKSDRGGGTIIVNSGDSFFGLPPGASARAHVQNIDLRPYREGGSISPSEALRRDERRSFRFRYRG